MMLTRQVISAASQSAQKPGQTRSVVSRLRLLILATFLAGIAGIGAELLLVNHTEDTLQWMPLILMAFCIAILAWHAIARNAASIRAFQVTMALFVVSGLVGLVVHSQAKMEFKREMDPSLTGVKLFVEAMKSQSPPALAPGILLQIALLGLAYTYRHPALGAPEDKQS